MHLAATIATALVAIEHVYILVMEMFLWQTPRGMRAFANTPEKAATTAVLAANQGLYNGFLAAGLGFALLAPLDALEAYHFQLFFLACVAVAGIYGGLTAFRRILFLQAGPALVALALVLAAAR